MQGVQDQETTRFNNQLNMERQALGQATQAGISNMQGGLQGIETSMNQQKAMDLYKNYGIGNNPNGVTNPSGGMGLSSLFGGGESPYANNPSPMWGSFESQGTPFLPYGQQSLWGGQ
jgi:hypothetical protein